MCELTHGMAGERHGRGMLCVNRPFLNAKALQRMRYAARILRYTSNDNELPHMLSSIEESAWGFQAKWTSLLTWRWFKAYVSEAWIFYEFLGAFAKLLKATISWSCLSVRLSIRLEHLGSHWMDFYEIWYKKSVEKIQVSFKPDRNSGYFTWRPEYIYENFSLSSA